MRTAEQQQQATSGLSSRPPTVLLVRARKPSRMLTETGFSVVSPYVEQFWQSALGPTSTALVRHLARHRLHIGDESARYTPVDLAVTRIALGIGRRGMEGRSGPLFKSVDRLARFGFLTIDQTRAGTPSHVTMATHVVTVPVGIQREWPDELVQRHDAFLRQILGGHGDR